MDRKSLHRYAKSLFTCLEIWSFLFPLFLNFVHLFITYGLHVTRTPWIHSYYWFDIRDPVSNLWLLNVSHKFLFAVVCELPWAYVQEHYKKLINRQHCAQRKAPVIYVTQRPILRFYAPQWRLVAPMGVKFGMEEGTKFPIAKFHPHDAPAVQR